MLQSEFSLVGQTLRSSQLQRKFDSKVILSRSNSMGSSLQDLRFGQRHATALAIHPVETAAGWILLGRSLSGLWVLVFFSVITRLIPKVLLNRASIVLLLPIAAQVAKKFAFSPITFMFIFVSAASNSLTNSIGYRTKTMNSSAREHRLVDFFRVGTFSVC